MVPVSVSRFALVVLGGLAALPALSQTPPANPGLPPAIVVPQSPQAASPPAMRTGPTDNQIADEVTARLAMLKANLRLTPEQEPKWAALDGALKQIMVIRFKARMTMEAERRAEREARRERWRQDRWSDMQTPPPPPQGEAQRPSEIGRMRAEADRMATRASELHRVADAADPLYQTLDQRQRGILIGFIDQGFGGPRR